MLEGNAQTKHINPPDCSEIVVLLLTTCASSPSATATYLSLKATILATSFWCLTLFTKASESHYRRRFGCRTCLSKPPPEVCAFLHRRPKICRKGRGALPLAKFCRPQVHLAVGLDPDPPALTHKYTCGHNRSQVYLMIAASGLWTSPDTDLHHSRGARVTSIPMACKLGIKNLPPLSVKMGIPGGCV